MDLTLKQRLSSSDQGPTLLTRAWQNKEVAAARCVALAITLVMIWYFITSDAIRSDNPFLVPDLLLTAFLLAAGLLPAGIARPALVFAFGWTSAVLTVSLFTYIVRDEFSQGANHLAMIIPSLAMAAILTLTLQKFTRGR